LRNLNILNFIKIKYKFITQNKYIFNTLFCAVISCVLLNHLFVNGSYIDQRTFWLDEATTFYVASRSLSGILTFAVKLHSQPPLYYFLAHYLIQFNDSVLFLRGASWFFILLLLIFILLFLSELKFEARLLFDLLLIFNSFTNYLSQEFRPYALASLLLFISTTLFLRLINNPQKRTLALMYALSTCLMMYTLTINLWVFISHGIYLAIVFIVNFRKNGMGAVVKKYRNIIVSIATISAIYLPYAISVITSGRIGNIKETSVSLSEILLNPQTYLLALKSFSNQSRLLLSFISVSPKPFLFLLIFLAMISFALYKSFKKSDSSVALWLIILLGQIVFVYYILHGRSFYAIRYLTPTFISFIFLIALGFNHLLKSSTFRFNSLLISAFLIIPLTFANYQKFYNYLKEPTLFDFWQNFHKELQEINGKKLILFQPVYTSHMLESITRDDPQIIVIQMSDNVKEEMKKEIVDAQCFIYIISRTDHRHKTYFPEMGKILDNNNLNNRSLKKMFFKGKHSYFQYEINMFCK